MDKTYIDTAIIDKYNYVQSLYPDHSFFGIFLRGSQNYGLDIYYDDYQSDIDTVAFIIPTLHDLIHQTTYNKEIICDDHSHIELKDIRDLLLLISKANPAYIELINTDYYIINPTYQSYYHQIQLKQEEFSFIDFNRLLSAIIAMMHTYLKKGFKNNTYDDKCLSHIIRFDIMATSLLQGHCFKEAMILNENDRNYLKQIKSHNIIYSYQEAYDIAIKRINKTQKMIDDYRMHQNPKFHQDAYNDLSLIIDNIIKEDICNLL